MIEVDLEGATIKGVNPAQNYVKSANFEGARLGQLPRTKVRGLR